MLIIMIMVMILVMMRTRFSRISALTANYSCWQDVGVCISVCMFVRLIYYRGIVHVCVGMFVCMSVCPIHYRGCVWVCVCMSVCLIHTCIHTYIPTNIHKNVTPGSATHIHYRGCVWVCLSDGHVNSDVFVSRFATFCSLCGPLS